MATETTWRCADGREIGGTVHAADEPLATVVVAPAMGVPRRFYRRFAADLAERGLTAVTFDYRGTDGRIEPGIRMADWGRLDIDAVLAAAHEDLPLFLIGHSCGGQLAGLAPASERLAGMVFVAAQSGHWRHWLGASRARMWLLWHLGIPALTAGRMRFPARRLGFFPVDVPAGVAAEWARWGRRRRYLLDPALGLDTDRYRRLAVPLLAYGFDDDGFAPPAAVDALVAEYSAAAVQRRQIAPAELGLASIGHFGFFRETARDTLWRETADWLLQQARNGTAGPAAGQQAGSS